METEFAVLTPDDATPWKVYHVIFNRDLSLEHFQEMWVQSLGQEDPLEKEMATHSSILTWKGPWTEKPGDLQSMGSLKSQA